VFKDEAPFLLEWIAYHRALGFERFVLYDNGSTDGGAGLVRASVPGPIVTVLEWPRRPAQLAAYRHFIYNFSADFEWAAFIDLDEFLLPLHCDGIADMLARFTGFSAVLVHWRVFGPSGWETRPDGLVIENYTWRSADDLPVNCHVKSIVRCSGLLDVTANPHEFQVKGRVCNTRGQAVNLTAIQPVPCHDDLVLNHYVTRSRRDWMAKIHRGSAMFEYRQPKYQPALFDHFAEVSHVRDHAIGRFAPRVRALLAAAPPAAPATEMHRGAEPILSIVAHIQNVGDVESRGGDWVGTRGGGRWIEGFSLIPQPGPGAADLEYQAIPGRDAVTPWMPGGLFCGSRGLGLPIRGFAVRLKGPAAARYILRYEATFVDGSLTVHIEDGCPCVASSFAPVESFRIHLQAAGG
jgi:hypothetical protein